MIIGKAIYGLLYDGGLSASVASRIYPMRRSQVLPQVPCIVYNIISQVPNNTKLEVSSVDTVRIQLNIFGQYDECQSIAADCRSVMDSIFGVTQDGILVQSSVFDKQFDDDLGEYTKGASTDVISLNRTVQEYIMRIVQ